MIVLTDREREILNIIKKDPLISQKQLANQLGIARSSVAVHIANLTKKGHIKGKGYVVNEGHYITVIGGANIDIQGFPTSKLNYNDSNPGTVKVSLGGVGRNIAENLAKLDINVKLITALGKDLYGEKIINECKLAGVDMAHSLTIEGMDSSTYLSILDETGDMVTAIAHMEAINELGINYIREKSGHIANSDVMVIDTNLEPEVIEYIVNNFKNIDKFLDLVSVTKAKKVKDIIGGFHTIKPNKVEAEALTGINIDTEENIKRAINYFLDSGVQNVFITLGRDGVYYGNRDQINFIDNPRIKVINTTGAGDAFTAALVYGYLNNYSIGQSTKFAMAASIVTLSHENTINPNLSIERINKKVEEMFI